ncbi:hypothetical protein BpHYR1_049688 [Brachionus plicatilis]|uniref:Uncharacterized protein n=1 Tax=Brachionus plicatilis TaxID=10195 RepID=A0A3M7R9I7_BRAPC|nr:hypothetical protein BpHYR1_049688 [Brachionus plicatilis]
MLANAKYMLRAFCCKMQSFYRASSNIQHFRKNFFRREPKKQKLKIKRKKEEITRAGIEVMETTTKNNYVKKISGSCPECGQ